MRLFKKTASLRKNINSTAFNNPIMPLPPIFDYIITGAGCAGSSLLMRMMADPFFEQKKILVIDRSAKKDNDRTWCFWEKEAGLFESIVYQRWERANFFSANYSGTLSLSPYQYKMIRGIDFYAYTRNRVAVSENISWLQEKIDSIEQENSYAIVHTASGSFRASYVFNSIVLQQPVIPPHKHLLLQHFKGWVIETKKKAFDAKTATLMDFRVSQERGTSFFYTMPFSATRALVEYTLFSETVLTQEAYDHSIREYLLFLGITDYTIEQEEFGAIPMTNISYPFNEGRIIHTGLAGGQVKGSSGYAFNFIQKRTAGIIRSLKTKGHPIVDKSIADKKFLFYDSVLLNVLTKRKMSGEEVFARIFQKNPAERVLRFLDNETGFLDDLAIMNSVPMGIFLPAALQEIFA
ncbi:MAG: hypothetical protein RLZZ28_1969 [Bacteroidota bacterium]|jgi:lycopene beta-cyclase